MLIGFFKKPAKCQCYITRYEDRIWLLENGDAQILRSVIVKVSPNSPHSLNEIRMLLPYKLILNLEDFYHACFLSPDENYFNSPQISTTQDCKVIQEPPDPPQMTSFGIIRDEVGENVKVFCRGNLSSFRIGDCSIIRYEFPNPLEKGESAEIRLKFQVNSLFDKVSIGTSPNYFVEFSYFSPKHINEINESHPKTKQIQVKPILGLEKSKFAGGFDIFLYFPPEFEEVSGFEKCFNKKYDTHNINGEETPIKRYKCLWRLRELLKKKGAPENKTVRIQENITISGVLTKRYDEKTILDSLTLKIKNITRQITQSTRLSYIAIGIAILSILLFLFSKK